MTEAKCTHCRERFDFVEADIRSEHKLMCGDSTSAEDVVALMAGERASCVLTDPPYGQNQSGVPGDEPENLKPLLSGALANLPLGGDAVVVAFASPRTFPQWLDLSREVGLKFERMLWLYKTAQMAYPWRGWLLTSEAILVSSKGSPSWVDAKPYAHDCYQVACVRGELDDDLGWHGSVKPLAIVEDIMSRLPRGIVYEPFAGSGTTIIAAARQGRTAYALELSPAYVDVCRRRWGSYARSAGIDPGPGAL